MVGDGDYRASDSDREAAVELLREAHAEGRLTLDEFQERMNTAYLTKTWAGLRHLTHDLPAELMLGTDAGRNAGLTPRAYPGGPDPRPAHRPGFGPLLPLAVIWIALAGAAHPATAVVIAAVLFLITWLRLAARHHDRGHGPGPGGSA